MTGSFLTELSGVHDTGSGHTSLGPTNLWPASSLLHQGGLHLCPPLHSLRLSSLPWAPFISPQQSSLTSLLVPGSNLSYCWCQVIHVPKTLGCGGGMATCSMVPPYPLVVCSRRNTPPNFSGLNRSLMALPDVSSR